MAQMKIVTFSISNPIQLVFAIKVNTEQMNFALISVCFSISNTFESNFTQCVKETIVKSELKI